MLRADLFQDLMKIFGRLGFSRVFSYISTIFFLLLPVLFVPEASTIITHFTKNLKYMDSTKDFHLNESVVITFKTGEEAHT